MDVFTEWHKVCCPTDNVMKVAPAVEESAELNMMLTDRERFEKHSLAGGGLAVQAEVRNMLTL